MQIAIPARPHTVERQQLVGAAALGGLDGIGHPAAQRHNATLKLGRIEHEVKSSDVV
jgi:hypothetical protein